MSKIIYNRHIVMRLWLICAAAYFVSYLTRSNFAAVTVEIIAETGWEKSAISAVTTALFISYGLGQIVSGWLGDHTRPEMVMTGGLLLSVAMNITIPFCSTIPQMTAVWAVNGLAQAMMWPPISRILAEYCTPEDYRKGTLVVSLGSSIATISVFLLASAEMFLSPVDREKYPDVEQEYRFEEQIIESLNK